MSTGCREFRESGKCSQCRRINGYSKISHPDAEPRPPPPPHSPAIHASGVRATYQRRHRAADVRLLRLLRVQNHLVRVEERQRGHHGDFRGGDLCGQLRRPVDGAVHQRVRFHRERPPDHLGPLGVRVDGQVPLRGFLDDGALDLWRVQPPDRRREPGLERDLHAHRARVHVGVELRDHFLGAANAGRPERLHVAIRRGHRRAHAR